METLAAAMRACANRHRLRLLRAVVSAPRPVRQSALVDCLDIPRFLAARYLQIPVHAGLVQRERRGVAVRYRAPADAPQEIRGILRLVRSLPLNLFDIPPESLERALRP